MEPGYRDPFADLVGRALMEPEYRDTLVTGSDEEKLAALKDAGLTEAQAEDVLPLLQAATTALNDLAGHDAFGVRVNAA
jgi:hypothetical protein